MRGVFVLATIVIVLALGVVAGAAESLLLSRVLIVGLVPAIWVAARAIERFSGRELWRFKAPYPYDESTFSPGDPARTTR